MATASSTRELRVFLEQAVNEVLPLTYTDPHGRTHKVYLSKAQEQSAKVSKGRDETVIHLTMVETEAEATEGGATGARLQEQFLIAAVDEVLPLTLTDPNSEKRRVFITKMQRVSPNAKSNASEWKYGITMVDAWSGIWIY